MWVEGWGELPGRLVVVSGPSGSGKSTLVRRLLERPDVHARLSVSATTRPPRPGEAPGVDYHFVTAEEFRAARDRGEFLEWAEYNRSAYGTPKRPVLDALAEGWNVVLEIEVQGALQVRQIAPTALFLFVKAPSFAAMERRLLARGTETGADLHRRLVRAREELAQSHWYDVQIINDQVDPAVDQLAEVIKNYG
jgi:guanylate kinase